MSPNWQRLHERHYADLGFDPRNPPPRCAPSCLFYGKINVYAFVVDGRAVFAILLIVSAPGTVTMTLFPGQDLFKHRRKVLVAARKDMEEYAVVENINRFEAVTKDQKLFHSFMKHCGFEIESSLLKYNNGEDCILWSHFPEKN